jgi:hypothetical protein
MKVMAFKLNPFTVYPRLTPYLSGRLVTCFAPRAQLELSATAEFRLPVTLRADLSQHHVTKMRTM